MPRTDSGGSGSRRPGQYHSCRYSHLLIFATLLAGSAHRANAQSSLLEIRIVEGDGQVSRAGSRVPHPLVLEVTDETGARVPDATLSFLLPESGVSGTFKNGLKTEILRTDEDGRAALRSLLAGGLAGRYQIRVMAASGLARAAAVSDQFVAPDTRWLPTHAGVFKPGRRVFEVGLLLVATMAAGAFVQKGGLGGGSSGSGHTATPPTIGPPSVTIGKP